MFFAAAAHAQGDDWLLKLGVHTVDPKSGNGTLAGGALRADVGSDTGLTISAERFVTPNWGVELLAWMAVLERVALSIAFPLMALSYVVMVFAAALVLKETISFRHAAGASLITAGVMCVGATGL